nr:SprT family zinc-dependent metalloprotease [Candidatus Sigynarchaeum springense]
MTGGQETREFHDDAFSFEYTITRTSRRTIGITIRPDGSIIVRVPRHVMQRQVDEVLAQKKGWIQKKRESIQARERLRPKPPEFADGDALPYLGQAFRLVVRQSFENKTRVEATGGSLVVHVQGDPDTPPQLRERARVAMVGWYKAQAHSLLPSRVEAFKVRLDVQPARVAIKDQRTRWGSCSSKGNVNLNWRLVLCPSHVLDYVVVHELCHLKINSHSASFWKLVASLVPDYKNCKQWLDSCNYLRDF